jgi:hypothetical protein
MSISETIENIFRDFTLWGNFKMEEKEWPDKPTAVVSPESFEEIKDALRKTLHFMIDLDFEDGKLDGAISGFLIAKKFQISLTFNLNPNDVILIRNLTKNKITAEVLENIRKARYSQS